MTQFFYPHTKFNAYTSLGGRGVPDNKIQVVTNLQLISTPVSDFAVTSTSMPK